MTYTVAVSREDDAWIADVVDLPGAHTFARNLSALDKNVREAIQLVLDVDEAPEYRYVYRNVDDDFLAASRIGDERQALESEQRALGLASAVLANRLVERGWSVRDISGALQISPGRVSQIVNAPGDSPDLHEPTLNEILTRVYAPDRSQRSA